MKRAIGILGIVLAAASLLLVSPAPSEARGGHGHGHVSFGVWLGPGFWGPWWGPRYYGDPYYYSPPVYTPPVVVQPAPPVAGPAPQQYWYYCQASQTYYPYVKECPAGWMQVVPQPTPPAP